MEAKAKQVNVWRIVAIALLVLCLILGALYAAGQLKKEKTAEEQPAASEQPVQKTEEKVPEAAPTEEPVSKEEALSLWTDDAPAKEMLVSYMDAITKEGGEDYIPVENRIAVFDLDGTLFCETDPNYFDYTLLVYRVLEDPDYKDQASDFEKEVANKIVEQNRTGASFSGLEVDHGKAVASAFSGMTIDEFNAYIQEFKKLPMPSYEGMKRGEGWYLPMLQIVDYLQKNDFTVYVVSGTDRFIVRGIVYDSPLNVPASQIIGSDESLVTPNQGDTDGLNYVYTDKDSLILGGDFLIKNLKMNKVTVIAQEIGIQPVLSFGNSTGDSSMAEYVTTNNPYASLAFMLCCDDTERENGNVSKADKMFALCEAYGWIPVSMKDDWKTIYGDGVTKKAAPKTEPDTEPAAPQSEVTAYDKPENWAYYEADLEKTADVFLVCPTVDMNDEYNMSLSDEKTKASFLGALNMERGIYEENARLFAPYYRQAAMKVYGLDRSEWEPYMEIAYSDVSAAFAYYLEHENNGRPIILAGFSQGADMCYRLLEEYFGDADLYGKLIAAYAIGWPCTEELVSKYPQIRPAAAADDTGVVISFDCEAVELEESFINPKDQKAYTINPLNWRTDWVAAEKEENLGACFTNYSAEIKREEPALCGCYIDTERGVIKVTGIDAADYPAVVPGLPEGSYHVYDYQFFYRNLQENVAVRTEAYLANRVNLSDDSSDFVLLSEAVPDAILEIRYYSTYNFVGDRIDGYEEPLAFLTKEAAAALKEVSDELIGMGYRLKIFDAYRPQMAVTHFMNWALDPDDTRMKEYFYPELEKDVLFPQGYIAEHSGHSRGSTVDLTLFDMTTEREVDMGGTFDYFGELSHPDYMDITEQQYENRMILREVMIKHGFRPLVEEWWHFTLENEPYPDTYFTFPINSDSIAASELDKAA